MWHDLIVALCLVLVVEGILPFLSPASWRKMVLNVVQLDDRSMRVMGLVSMLIGVGVLWLINR
ncbi:MAG: DUF2065 domain-containing protein [Oceanicoccus sp.]